ncbi:probable sodium/potassium/calcium exchanger CG1090 [Neocloeon triangulifer]|uniref:probable sodium/potassium/calcium exchanger CG1090 n=1 Tax=Neocloeon triangulifer TaxID=2078957 RepID=UPI00286EC130|nr:probable sodium/potassium/calcium exchanger CG1090 [Neocloeon triangulifer]XP_059490723.1 probable sodium/potassium/calcium exchanger CG1090 [Neocloeon triangulifer]XP_059490724.1 probable sodium/potassium/calcium exchanger CG1090 [Neocloeon triangulifer]XP_059490725.1 probable sodium/potassium/calcium exchanger CG1090 [Neocloeon triangulifer]XP_059490726.1 probable sodium/potassium/calcium exchanger CG1090 [Neocloeon triangulifer]
MRQRAVRAAWRFAFGMCLFLASSTVNSATTRPPPHAKPLHTTKLAPITPNATVAPIIRDNCTPPAIEQFPRPMMSPETRRSGGLIIHVLVAIYTFVGLAIVCDDYFVASLDRICEELKLSPDVAGATFMAAGSSAPELATVIIGVFFAKDDIGVSGVIGSAVFNIMFVISVCALCSGTVSYLNWWPLVRDCFFYMVSILVMLLTIYDETITWSESLFMLFMYGVYCVALRFNKQLEQWAQTLPIPCKSEVAHQGPPKVLGESSGLAEGQRPNSYTEEKETEFGNTEQQLEGAEGQPEYYHKAPRPEMEETDPFVIPEGTVNRCLWAITLPIHALCKATTPDCRKEKHRDKYAVTFFMSMVWISFFSYIMVWMITVIGSTLGIPDTVMGLTFVAAGVSVPDALSSLAVVKEGYGDMAVSNAVGSNVFDILICLGLPWFLQTAIISPGSTVTVISKGLTYSTLSLLSTVAFLIIATHMNGWKLDRKYGWILMAWYLFFIIFASLYELNVFGYMNPPECPSIY